MELRVNRRTSEKEFLAQWGRDSIILRGYTVFSSTQLTDEKRVRRGFYYFGNAGKNLVRMREN